MSNERDSKREQIKGVGKKGKRKKERKKEG